MKRAEFLKARAERRKLVARLREEGRWRIGLRAELVAAQGQRCGICGKRLFADFKGRTNKGRKQEATLDHVEPRCRSTRNEGNLLAVHLKCNRAKADRAPTGCELIWLAAANAGLG